MGVGTSSDSVRRIAVASVLIVVVLAAAIGVTIWRYNEALTQSDHALRARSDAAQAQSAVTAFWQEREAMNEHLAVGSSTQLAEVAGDHTSFIRAMRRVSNGTSTQRVEATRAIAANEKLVSFFNVHANGGPNQLPATIAHLSDAENPVTTPLDALQRGFVAEIGADEHTASAARSQALTAALVGGALAILIGIAFAFYTRRLAVRVAEREARLSALVSQT